LFSQKRSVSQIFQKAPVYQGGDGGKIEEKMEVKNGVKMYSEGDGLSTKNAHFERFNLTAKCKPKTI
jgi:hypothetical protein